MPTSVSDMIIMVSLGVLILLGFRYLLDFIQMWVVHRMIREAIRANFTGAADLLANMAGAAPKPRDDRTGLILVAIAVALIGFTLIVGDRDWLRYGLGASLFPLAIGGVLLLRFYRLGGADAGI